MEKSADDLEFSAEGLSGNAKIIKFSLPGELTLHFLPNYVYVLPNSLIKNMKTLHVFIENYLTALFDGTFWRFFHRFF